MNEPTGYIIPTKRFEDLDKYFNENKDDLIRIAWGNVKADIRPHVTATPEPSYQELVDFARWTQTFWKNGIEIMRKNNLVIKTDEPMEKLAFTFYSDLCEIDSVASHLFREGYGDKNHRDESDVVGQTITAYPKPYEERVKARALAPLKAVQEKFDHLDKCLSDPGWCEAGETSAIYGIAGELWRAIKEAMGDKL